MYIFWPGALALFAIPNGMASQVPLKYGGDFSLTNENELWDLFEGPPENSTSHLIFDTMNSLLQHWGNTRYRNGHTIIPATIPTGTILYHGALWDKLPLNPEWVATDAEHARYFCEAPGTSENNTGCWQVTLAVTSPLRLLYFDGSSAAKLDDGPMDTQDILLWGKSRPDLLLREDIRICELCEWGKKYGIHGYLRMEMDFEIMLCNFTRDVEVVSFLNLASELAYPPEHRPPPNVNLCEILQEPSIPIPTYIPRAPVPRNVQVGMGTDTMEVGTWHNYYPGDTRIIPDLSRAISFYDIHSFPSLVTTRLGKERWYHRAGELDALDLQTFRKRADEVLADDQWQRATAVDWRAQLHVITNRYGERLETLRYMVVNITDPQRAVDRAYDQLRKLLSPYRLYTAVPDPGSSNHSWAIPVFKLCATTHTVHLFKLPTLTPSETMLLHSMKDVNKEICRVLVNLWAEGVERGLVPWKEMSYSEDGLREMLTGWKDEVDRLMKWLDWGVWVKCPEPCRPEEMCYMPTWPFFLGLKGHSPLPQHQKSRRALMRFEQLSLDTPSKSLPWQKPQPRCVRKFPPYNDIFT